jgi:UDP-N-acetylglucosamine:LPS N-acetylglucosamine transferase
VTVINTDNVKMTMGRREREHDTPRRHVLAISSCGGHWVQLLRLRPAFAGMSVTYASTDPGNRDDVAGVKFYRIPDASLQNKKRLLWLALNVGWLVLRLRPDVIVSTGAAPGYFAMRIGKLIGVRTVWIDSVANAEHMSLCGRHVKDFADLWLTQWPDIASGDGPRYMGAVL